MRHLAAGFKRLLRDLGQARRAAIEAGNSAWLQMHVLYLVDLVCDLERPYFLPLSGKGVSRIFELVGVYIDAYSDRLLLRTAAGAWVAELLED